MFGEVIDFDTCCNQEDQIEFLYQIFKCDFIDNRCYIAQKIYINPQSNKKKDGKEEIFWHIVTRKNRRKRELDPPRATRIKWVKNIILCHNHKEIKMFYYLEDNGKIRLYLWAYNYDFVVILQKLGNRSSYLVTSFYIDNQKKKNKFQKKFEDYINQVDNRLNGCEWF
jgi:hypothetical protein